MNLKELKEILHLLEERDIVEFELEEQGMKLRIRKAAVSTGVSAPAVTAFPVPSPAPAPAAAAPAAGRPPETPAAAPEPAPAEDGQHVVKSPIVGTFYRSPDPNTAPFVEVGDHVRTGQVLCIVEAMKLMNEIEAEVPGTILKVHAENGQPVQYGDSLFTLRTD